MAQSSFTLHNVFWVKNALVNNIRHKQIIHRYRHMCTVSVVLKDQWWFTPWLGIDKPQWNCQYNFPQKFSIDKWQHLTAAILYVLLPNFCYSSVNVLYSSVSAPKTSAPDPLYVFYFRWEFDDKGDPNLSIPYQLQRLFLQLQVCVVITTSVNPMTEPSQICVQDIWLLYWHR